MSLITRQAKGSKLTIQEMDGNLTYLESNGFRDGEYSQTQEGTGEIIGDLGNEVVLTTLFPLADASIGIYTVSPTGGSGTGAQFELEVIESGRGGLVFDFSTSTILNGGSGYQVGDELTIPSAAIGGITAGEVRFILNEGSVDVTQTSAITVSPTGITLDTSELAIGKEATPAQVEIYGDITLNGDIFNVSSIGTLGIQAEFTGTRILSVSNPFGDTTINFSNLPTTDPQILGQLWVDTANGFVLKVSQGE